MSNQHVYEAPQTEIIRMNVEQLLASLSTQHQPNVQDEYEDDNDDEDAPFTFSKKYNWYDNE